MVEGDSRLYGLLSELMGKVLGSRLPQQVYFAFQDPVASQFCVGQARLYSAESQYCAECVWLRRLGADESIKAYLNTIASQRPETVICDPLALGSITGEMMVHRQRSGRYLVACKEGFVKIRPAIAPVRKRPSKRQKAALEQRINERANELVQTVGSQCRLPQKMLLAVSEGDRIYMGPIDISYFPKLSFSGGFGLSALDEFELAQWLAENTSDAPMLCSKNIADTIAMSSQSDIDGCLRVVQCKTRPLEVYAPQTTSLSPDVLQVQPHLRSVLQETLLSGCVPLDQNIYVLVFNPDNATYYHSMASVKPSGAKDASVDFTPPEPLPGQSPNDIAESLIKTHPGVPLICDRQTLDDICILHPAVGVERHMRAVTFPDGMIEAYFPNPLL